jgi:GTP-binding protein EngB required for normal cell division
MTAPLDERLAALADAATLARGRLDEERVDAADAVVARAGKRLGLGVEVTVVALAGPTGAGKSMLFNALAGEDLTRVSHRRPTTSAATAAVWGDVGDALLDWLEVPRRHRRAGEPSGLVLLDLPDFDSVELSHRIEVERVIGLADLMAWVVDPQKYADGVLHEQYLRRFSDYGDAMVVVLNQADRLDAQGRAACRSDLRKLLADDGLPEVPVLAVSALTGEGIDELRALLEQRVSAREAAVARLAADVASVGAALAAACGTGTAGRVERRDRDALTAALGEAAGAPAVVRAVADAHRRRGALATGWPYVRWLRRLRPDPLRRLRLLDRVESDDAAHPSLPGAVSSQLETDATRAASAQDATRESVDGPPSSQRGAGESTAARSLPAIMNAGATTPRSSLPAPTSVQRAQVETAARALAGRTTGRLDDPWPGLVRRAALAREEELPARLEAAVSGTDLRMRRPRWWRGAGLLQILLAIVTLTGGLWLLALAGLGYLQLDDVVPTPEIGDFPLPTLLLGGGALAGILLAFLAGLAIRAGARRRARVAERALRARVRAAGEELIIAPVQGELEAHGRLCAALAAAAPAASKRRQVEAAV